MLDIDFSIAVNCGLMSPIEQAFEIIGGVSAVARICGRSPQQVHQWKTGERPVPAQYCLAIEKASGGQITRRDLRPDDWHLFWPDLQEQAAE
jgi:DNA-binding transcriptional regulator YdaS (Cro superfamily)